MSVETTSQEVNHHSLGAVLGSRRMPIGIWTTRLQITGDATGGHILARMELTPRSVYTLEGIGVECAGIGGQIRANWNPGISAPGGDMQQQWAMLAITVSGLEFAAGRDIIPGGVPWTLCPALATNQQAVPQLHIQWDTNTNADLYTARAWGYYYDRRVLIEGGGPLRPSIMQ